MPDESLIGRVRGYNGRMEQRTFLVFLGGSNPDLVSPRARGEVRSLEEDVVVIAADGGFHRAAALGVRVDHLIGDLDSIDPEGLREAEADATVIRRYPTDKDATDAELAVRLAIELRGGSPGRMLVIGGAEGRLDHLLADVMLLASARTSGFTVTAHLGEAIVTVIGGGTEMDLMGSSGEQVSLLALTSTARGITTDGLRWPLTDAVLTAGSTRGVSNELSGQRARVQVAEGTLIAIQQGIAGSVVGDRTEPYDDSPR